MVNHINAANWLPLYYVAERKNPRLIKLLLDKGAGIYSGTTIIVDILGPAIFVLNREVSAIKRFMC